MKTNQMICIAIVAMMAITTLTASPFKQVRAQSGDPTYTESSTGLPTDGQYSHVTCADMTKDGKFDIIAGADKYPSATTHGLYVWTGDGTGKWTKSSNGLPTTENFGGTAVGDLNKDNNMDLVSSYETWSGSPGKGVGVWLGNGGSGGLSFTEGVKPTDKDGYDDVFVGDINGDGNSDIIGGSHGVGIKVWLGNGGAGGTLSWTEKDSGLPTSGEYTGVTAADVNGDSKLDIAAGNYQGKGVQVWIQNADGSWTEASDGLVETSESFDVAFGYFNNDKHVDLAATVRGQGVYVWLGNGGVGGSVNWTVSRTGLPTSGDYKQIDIDEMDNNINKDLVVAEVDKGIGVYLGNGGAGGSLSFDFQSDGLPTSGTYYGATFCRINNDVIADVIGASWGSGIKAWITTIGPVDSVAPGKIDDLAAETIDYKSAKLTWTATGDDGINGKATSYDIRYSSTRITSMSEFNSSFKVTNPPTPKDSRAKETFVVNGLSANTTYFFAIVVFDEADNPSALSYVPTIRTMAPPANPKPPIITSMTPANHTTVSGVVHIVVAFTDGDNDVNEMELYLDGSKIDSKNSGSSPYTVDWDSKNGTTKVSNGDHILKVTIRDQAGLSTSAYTTVKVSNKSTKKEQKGFIPGFEAILLIGALAVALAMIGKQAKGNKA
jgi:hypothetical protein